MARKGEHKTRAKHALARPGSLWVGLRISEAERAMADDVCRHLARDLAPDRGVPITAAIRAALVHYHRYLFPDPKEN